MFSSVTSWFKWFINGGRLDIEESAISEYLTPSAWDVFVGVTLTISGGLLVSWGQLLPKIGGDSVDWRSITVFIVFGNLLHLLGLWFAPASLLAPTNSVGLFGCEAIIIYFTDTRITTPIAAAFIAITVGVIMCSIAAEGAGALTSSVTQYHQLMLSSWKDPSYLTFIGSLVGISLAILAVLRKVHRDRLDHQFKLFLSAPHYMVGKKQDLIDKKLAQTLSICFAALAGIMGSQTVCQVKECEAVFKELIQNPHYALTSITPYIAVSFLVFSGVGQYLILKPAYTHGDATTVSAVYYSVWTLLGAIAGFIKFKEHQRLSTNQTITFSAGLLVCTLAIMLMCYKSVHNVFSIIARKSGELHHVKRHRELTLIPLIGHNNCSRPQDLSLELPRTGGYYAVTRTSAAYGRSSC